MFEANGPTGSEFWHWVVVDIPPGVTELKTDAGHPSGRGMPGPAHLLPDGPRRRRAAPRHRRHRYARTVGNAAVPARRWSGSHYRDLRAPSSVIRRNGGSDD